MSVQNSNSNSSSKILHSITGTDSDRRWVDGEIKGHIGSIALVDTIMGVSRQMFSCAQCTQCVWNSHIAYSMELTK